MAVNRLGMVVHRARPTAVAAARTAHAWAAAHGISCFELDVWRGDRPRLSAQEESAAAGHPDLIVTFGGDGTFLRGARLAAGNGAAVLGVNVGRVGFLTEITADQVEEALDAIHDGRNTIEERMMLTLRASRPLEMPEGMEALLRYGRGPVLPPPKVRPGSRPEEVGWGVPLDAIAVNDVVFEKLARDRQAGLGVYVSGQLLAAYSADAIIVATPTGSTAYSFAAGGPVVSPYMDAVVFTPVAPHIAFDRTVVAAVDEAVAVRVLPTSGRVAVSLDGQLRGVLEPGDWVAAYRAPVRLRLVRLAPTQFYHRLRDRFRLADSPAADPAPPFYRPRSPVPADLAHLRLPPEPGEPPEPGPGEPPEPSPGEPPEPGPGEPPEPGPGDRS